MNAPGHRTLTPADIARPVDLLSGIAGAVGGPIDIHGGVILAQKIGASPMRTLVVLILLLAPSLAVAQNKTRLPDPLKVAAELGGAIRRPAPMAAPEQLWRKIQAADAADLKYAKALADSAGSPGARLRSACYGAWIVTIEQAEGAGLKDAAGNAPAPPQPHAFSSFERLAEVADALQPTAPLMAACAPAWTALRLTAVQFFTLAVSGAVGLSALGVAIP